MIFILDKNIRTCLLLLIGIGFNFIRIDGYSQQFFQLIRKFKIYSNYNEANTDCNNTYLFLGNQSSGATDTFYVYRISDGSLITKQKIFCSGSSAGPGIKVTNNRLYCGNDMYTLKAYDISNIMSWNLLQTISGLDQGFLRPMMANDTTVIGWGGHWAQTFQLFDINSGTIVAKCKVNTFGNNYNASHFQNFVYVENAYQPDIKIDISNFSNCIVSYFGGTCGGCPHTTECGYVIFGPRTTECNPQRLEIYNLSNVMTGSLVGAQFLPALWLPDNFLMIKNSIQQNQILYHIYDGTFNHPVDTVFNNIVGAYYYNNNLILRLIADTCEVYTRAPQTITIIASINPVCTDSVVTFTATINNYIPSPIYQWKVNGNNVGTNSSTFTYQPINGDTVICDLSSNTPCLSSTSNNIIMQVGYTPIINFPECFDTLTTLNSKPIKLKGATPLGGTYSGIGVNSLTGYFDPTTAGIGTHTIIYSYVNSMGCSANSSRDIVVSYVPPFICGQSLIDIRDYKFYNTVQIGAQCWMASNLNYGSQIPFTNNQRDNCFAEKYCLEDNSVYCNQFGGLYQWDELMCYNNEEEVQGFCPPEWHIPTLSEWNELVTQYYGFGLAGVFLKSIGTSGFNALLTGIGFNNRVWKFGLGDSVLNSKLYWTSSSHGQYKAWAHGINDVLDNIAFTPSINTYPSYRNNGFAVRCIKDNISLGPCQGIPSLTYDGQIYHTIEIGTQCWLRENLNIGTRINSSKNQVDNDTIEKYCYNEIESNCDIYGGLYQWEEMMNYTTQSNLNPSGRQGICPPGWHVPSDAEWCQMEVYLDPTIICSLRGDRGTDCGGKMKETGTIHWSSPNTGATNSSGFTALPGGYKNQICSYSFEQLGTNGYFWSTTIDVCKLGRGLFYNSEQIYRDCDIYCWPTYAFSVRCVKD